tara:strand:+ start:16318 stop:16755 length:438 start_codon:yes stop_codon:yes gene_type:complete
MKLFYGIVLALMVVLSACAQQTVQPAAEPSAPPATAPVVVEPETEPEGTGDVVVEPETTTNEVRALGSGAFEPAELTVSAGSSVTWMNDAGANMVVIIFKDGQTYMTSQKIDSGEKFEHEFTEAGEYEYWQNVAYGGDSSKITVS